MKRRDFVVRLSGAALAWPVVALAQRATIPFIGYLSGGLANERAHLVEAFRQGLKEGGYVDGRDVAIEHRSAEGRYDRLPGLAAELVSRKVAVIYATGGSAPAVAAKAATSTIPIVFNFGADPVKLGLVASLGRPGGNVTGIANIAFSLEGKRLEILRDLLPGAARIAFLMNPKSPNAEARIKEMQVAAAATRTELQFLNASNEREIDEAFTTAKQRRVKALLPAADALFTSQRNQIVALAERHAIPGCYSWREFVEAGGLMSYGPKLTETHRLAGLYTARILKGAKPADLPVIQADKHELVVNLKTAKTLGIAVSRDFLARVDEVIQ